ncbi:hypothetical protein [Aequorivita echinoideorum]|uniref:hypothetical protein n=1 Tax=Aequorivita echinoideorum TaxID=1549647 RepID=UPI001BD94E18|nr:hypothetical protein [Aequorivita echinoideorum]
MKKDNTDKISILFVLNKNFAHKAEYYRRKYQRARNQDIRENHYKKYRLYNDLCQRCRELFSSLVYPKKFGWGRHFWEFDAKEYIEKQAKYKQAKKDKFETAYRIHLHFFQNSFSADYGTYNCDRCKRQFHHSPSDVYLGSKKKFSHCCGHCVNTLLERNGQETIFN